MVELLSHCGELNKWNAVMPTDVLGHSMQLDHRSRVQSLNRFIRHQRLVRFCIKSKLYRTGRRLSTVDFSMNISKN